MTQVAVPGRALAAWWRQLTPLRPRRLWLADWLVHRLEVLAAISRPNTLDPLPRLLLDALSFGPVPTPTSLAIRLGVDAALVARLLNDLIREGLALIDASGFSIADDGRAALAGVEALRDVFERRSFCLVADPPAFLPLLEHGTPVALNEPPPAPLDALREYLTRPADWKGAASFPEDVTAIADLNSPAPPSVAAWTRIPVDRPERLVAALALLPDGCVQGFAARGDTWAIGADAAFTLHPPALPPLPEPSADELRTAWLLWAHGLPDADRAPLDRVDHELIVAPDAALAARLRVARPDLTRNEAWILVGTGPTRSAVRVVVR